MRLSSGGKIVVILFAIGLGAGVGVVDATRQTLQLPAALLLASGVLLGALNPRLAWVWAAVMGLCVVSARAAAEAGRQTALTSMWLPLIILPLAIAVFGVAAGLALRRLSPEHNKKLYRSPAALGPSKENGYPLGP